MDGAGWRVGCCKVLEVEIAIEDCGLMAGPHWGVALPREQAME